jgi:hypothetical protein
MNRFLAIVAAAAACAAVAAAITIPAGADPPTDADAQLVDCLRAHGADLPSDARGVTIKEWVRAHENDDAAARALKACGVGGPVDLVACLRDHGLDVPSAIEDLKPWLLRHADDPAAKTAFSACHFGIDAKRSDGPAVTKGFTTPDCGPGKPATPGTAATPETTPAPGAKAAPEGAGTEATAVTLTTAG